MTATATRRKTSPPTRPETMTGQARKIQELEEEVYILRRALDEVKTQFDRESENGKNSRANYKTLYDKWQELKEENQRLKEEMQNQEEDYQTLFNEFERTEKAYIIAKSLINIPANLKDLVFELVKTRLLVFDEIKKGGADITDSSPDVFEWFTDLVKEPESPAPKRSRKSK